MLRFCLGDLELTYSLRNGEPAAIVARFSEPFSNHDAALMLQLAARIRVVIDAVPAWSAARMVILRTPPRERRNGGRQM